MTAPTELPGETDGPPHVRYEKRCHVGYVTLDRPAVLNAMDLRMHEELAAVWDAVEADDDVRVVVLTGAGGAFRLARQLPLKAAMGYLLTGRRMSAPVAYQFGLVNDVVPADGLDRCVAEWTDDLLRAAPLAVRAIKESVQRSLHLPLPEAFATPYEWERRRQESRDAVEGPRAFAEKRDPVWEGR